VLKARPIKIHITYTGYTDTTFEVSTDKNGALNANNVLVKLKKDGMRLMGVVKSAEEDFPIQGAVVDFEKYHDTARRAVKLRA
jgi:hypothetical protein